MKETLDALMALQPAGRKEKGAGQTHCDLPCRFQSTASISTRIQKQKSAYISHVNSLSELLITEQLHKGTWNHLAFCSSLIT